MKKFVIFNFLHSSSKQDIGKAIFIPSNRAVGIFNELVSGPLFRKVEETGHVFLLNSLWKDLSDYRELCSRDASSMLDGKTFFEEKYVTNDCKITRVCSERQMMTCLTALLRSVWKSFVVLAL